MNLLAPPSQAQRDGGGDGGLAHTALAHCEDHALALRSQRIDHVVQHRDVDGIQGLLMGGHPVGIEQRAYIFYSCDVVGAQRNHVTREFSQTLRHRS